MSSHRQPQSMHPPQKPARERNASTLSSAPSIGSPSLQGSSRTSVVAMPSMQSIPDPNSEEPQDGEKEMDSWRLALLGDGGVGKTALAVQTYDPTIEDAYRKSTKIGDQRCFLEIIDTAGQEEYATIRDQWVWESAAFVLVFSLGSYKSLDRIKLFYTTVMRVQRSDPILILVGNKLDQKRVVSVSEAIAFANEIGATYIETSAKTAHNVSTVFTEPITRLRNKHAHVAESYDLKGRLQLPPNPQSIEAPPGAIAAVAAQEAARANSDRRGSSEKYENLGTIGPIIEAAMPLNQVLLGYYPDGPSENPEGYLPGGQTGPSVFEHQLPYGTPLNVNAPAQPPTRTSGGSSTPRGTRSRSGTNASLTGTPGWPLQGGHATPPLPGRNGRSATISAEESRPTRKMSDPQPPHLPSKSSPSSDKNLSKKKSGSLAVMFSKNRKPGKVPTEHETRVDKHKEKDGNCVVQ